MKKFILLFALLLSCATLYVQNDVTRFLGIPVDGSKSEMTKKIMAKGFSLETDLTDEEYLFGNFNGVDVRIYIQTYKDKVCRVAVFDDSTSDQLHIKRRFNRLCSQFGDNSKYVSNGDQSIDEDEILQFINNAYEAFFYQKSADGSSKVNKNKLVWLSIDNCLFGTYRIIMYYDNVYNMAHGEDL